MMICPYNHIFVALPFIRVNGRANVAECVYTLLVLVRNRLESQKLVNHRSFQNTQTLLFYKTFISSQTSVYWFFLIKIVKL